MNDNTTASATDGLTVETRQGAVRGLTYDGVRAWRSIPYAAPPVGPLRLRAPQPAAPWEGVRDATEFGPVPPQVYNKLTMPEGTPMSEDCLTLNVWAPAEPAEKPRPVIVWFYGGAFTSGAASTALYDSPTMATEGGVIYVTINYRLGVLGFLDYTSVATPEHPFDSNVGLRDQVAGLTWVRDNIAAFGGDPDNVTIFGQSAGGMSVVSLMAIPSAKGLFHKAFALSPAPASVYSSERHAGWVADFATILGVDGAETAEAIATRPWQELVTSFRRLTGDVAPGNDPGTLAASPVVDGDFFPKHTLDAFRDGSAHNVPLIIGTMAREGQLFTRFIDQLPTTRDRIEKLFTRTDAGARDRILAAYPGYPRKKVAIDFGGDYAFWFPTAQATEAHSRHAPTWAYRFDYALPGIKLVGLGATHAMELPALFNNVDGMFPGATRFGGRAVFVALGRRMRAALYNLAHTGEAGDSWPRYDETDRKTLIFDATDRVESDPHGERRRAWGDFRGYL